MKNIKLFLAIIVAFFALTQAKSQSYNFDNPVRINSWLQVTQNHPGTHANRIFGISPAGPGVTGSFGNYIYIGGGLSLANDTLSFSVTGSGLCGDSLLGLRPNGTVGPITVGGGLQVTSCGLTLVDSLNFSPWDTIAGGNIVQYDTTKNVGIGTLVPTNKFDVVGNSNFYQLSGNETSNVNFRFDNISLELINPVDSFQTILDFEPSGVANIISKSPGTKNTINYANNGLLIKSGSQVSDNISNLFLANSGAVLINYTGSALNSRVGIGTGSPAAVLDVTSTTSAFLPPRMTEAQRDAIATPVNGMILYNSTTDKLQVRAAGAWVDLH